MKNFALVFIVFGFFQCSMDKDAEKGNTIFRQLPSSESGIDFQNQVEDTQHFNILSYRNFYNGGGVGIGDINNDGLADIYFTANQKNNRLYLNKGDFQFEDITTKAGVAGRDSWCTGVAFADVNADGLLDIYVCYSGIFSGDQRKNELFTNNGDLTFTESASQFGLDSDSFSTHATFADFDTDGDLDCFLLNNSFVTPGESRKIDRDRSLSGTGGGDQYFRNDNGLFVDVSSMSGIHTGDVGFGLGVSVGDLNNDMLPDIYVSNDFWEIDYLYINKGDGTFEDKRGAISTTSLNSMGSDIGDLNNDGYPEIMSTDMLPPDNYRIKSMTQFMMFNPDLLKSGAEQRHQIMQNALQLNRQGEDFVEIAHFSNVAASDWSWGALVLDLDLDGWKDIFISNGIQKDITDFDFVETITDPVIRNQMIDENGELDVRNFLPFLPVTKISNCAFINNKNLTFENSAIELGLDAPSFSNGSAYGDLDNDGDLDLVLNNANMEAFVFQNRSVDQKLNKFLKIEFAGPLTNPFGIGVKVEIFKGSQMQEMQHFLSRGFQSSVAPGLHFGVGQATSLDSVKVYWPDGKVQNITNVNTNQVVSFEYKNSYDNFLKKVNHKDAFFAESKILPEEAAHLENDFNDFEGEPLTYKMLSREGSEIISGDVDSDGLEDFILLGAAGAANRLFIQNRTGSFTYLPTRDFEVDKSLEVTCGALFDFDGDSDMDLVIGHGGNEIAKGRQNFSMRLYENDGGKFSLSIASSPQVGGNLSCIRNADIDKDGDQDLFIGARSVPGNYGLVPSSFVLLNNGNGTWRNITTEEFGRLGMVTDAAWSDIDNDEDLDLVVVGDWMPITIFENLPGEIKKKGIIPETFGWWNTIKKADLDNDGDDDFVLGNWGLNSKLKASVERPLKMYVKDFDRNGKAEQILTWYPTAEDMAYPFVTKDEIIGQIPNLNQMIRKHAEYADMSYEQLFDEEQRKGALSYKADRLESVVMWNDDTVFNINILPNEAQLSTINSIVVEDVNNDDMKDLVLFGNSYGLKPAVGRMDGNKGIVLVAGQNRNFDVKPRNGLKIKGEVRDATFILDGKGTKHLLIGRNNLPMNAFLLKE